MDHCAISDNRDFTSVSQNFSFADFEKLWFPSDIRADAVAARVAYGSRSGVLDHCEHHVAHLAFVFRRHHDDVGNGTHVSDVEQAVMSLSVSAGDAAAVETKLDVQILNA